MPARDVDDQVRKIVLEPRIDNNDPKVIDNAFACSIIESVEVQQRRLAVKLKPSPDDATESKSPIVIPWTKPPSKRA